MKFAENNQISQRQLYRQIVIAFIAPLILCLFENRKTLVLGGLAGTAAALAAVPDSCIDRRGLRRFLR